MESLLAALPPLLSAAITGIVTYLGMRNKSKLTMTEKEYEYIVKERNLLTTGLSEEIATLRKEKAELQHKLDLLDAKEEECQRNLLQHKYYIRELETKLGIRK